MLKWIVVGSIFLCVGVFITTPIVIMNVMLGIHINYSTREAKDFGLEPEHVFVKTDDGLNISTYEIAVDSPKAVIICLSGIHFPSATIYFGHAQLFKEHNFATIILDMRSHGKSDGNKICVGYKEWLDVKAVVKFIKEKPLYNDVPVFVFGLSMGGATAINAIGEITDIDGLISLSAFSSWEEVFYQKMEASLPTVIAKIEKPFISLATYLKFGEDSRTMKPKKSIEKLGDRPALLMHSKEDSQVHYKNFDMLLKHAPLHVETFIREGDNHFITKNFANPKEDEEYMERIIQFIKENANR
jgi:alpha-beta hydrolase superfamily lysophospholipase